MTEPPVDAFDAGLAEGFAIGRFNLAVLGATGAGKSTLINQVFGEELAATGIGAPVTQGSQLYRQRGRSLGIFDTKGLEVGQDNAEILAELRAFIDANRLGDLADQIHVVWYCTHAGGQRLQPAEEDFIRQLLRLGLPVLSVITQVPRPGDQRAGELAATVASRLPELRAPVLVNALGDSFTGVEPFGLDELLARTAELAPQGVRTALAAAQRVSARQKRAQSAVIIDLAASGVSRIALSRELGERWATMFAQIASVYQLPEDDAREVIASARTVRKLRGMLRRGQGGVLFLALGPILGLGAAAALGSRRVAARLNRNQRAAIEAAGADEIPLAVEELPDDAPPDRERIGSGFAAGQVTRGLGDAWRATCEYYWTAAFPEPPGELDPDEVAQRFAAQVTERLPRHLKRWGRAD